LLAFGHDHDNDDQHKDNEQRENNGGRGVHLMDFPRELQEPSNQGSQSDYLSDDD